MVARALKGDAVPHQPFAPEGRHKRHKITKGTKKTLFFVPSVPFVVFVALLHRHRLREISWLVDVTTASDRDVIRKQLQRDDRKNRRE